MATIYEPQFELTINGFNVSDTVKKYLISIQLENSFDANFTVSKLDVVFHSNYQRSLSWKAKDQLQVKLWWKPFPQFVYTSPVFYLDYVTDNKASSGLQTYLVSALSAEPELGFKYFADDITYTNKTVKTALSEFATSYNLNLTENVSNNVYLGVINNYANTNNRDTVVAKFNSYAEFLRHVCNKFGYLGSLNGRDLRILKIDSDYTTASRFFIQEMNKVNDINFKQTFNRIRSKYSLDVIDRDDGNKIKRINLIPTFAGNLNSKEVIIDPGDAHYNAETASEALYGAMYGDYINNFEIEIRCSGLPGFTAGYVFLLDSTYGSYEGYYRCTKVRHTINSSGWNSVIYGFPLSVLAQNVAYFQIGYYGSTTFAKNPDNNFNLSQQLSGRTYVLGANKFDEFAKILNPDYTFNFGNLFLEEGNKDGNRIKPDFAFCVAMFTTNNFRDEYVASKNNPFGLGELTGAIEATFPSMQIGIRAGIQHLYAYANQIGNPQDPLVDPRWAFVTRGIAPRIDDLSGRWLARIDMGRAVRSKILEFYRISYPSYTTQFID